MRKYVYKYTYIKKLFKKKAIPIQQKSSKCRNKYKINNKHIQNSLSIHHLSQCLYFESNIAFVFFFIANVIFSKEGDFAVILKYVLWILSCSNWNYWSWVAVCPPASEAHGPGAAAGVSYMTNEQRCSVSGTGCGPTSVCLPRTGLRVASECSQRGDVYVALLIPLRCFISDGLSRQARENGR